MRLSVVFVGLSLEKWSLCVGLMRANRANPAFDFQYGETDLAENQLRWPGGTYALVGALVLATVICVGSLLVGAARFLSMFPQARVLPASEIPQASTSDALILVTNTAHTPLVFSTVTAAPPTRTSIPTEAPTATPGPCMQKVQAGDSLIGLVSRCGHRDLDIIDLVLEINNLESAEFIQSGQTLEIPWPTPTVAPNEASDVEAPTGDADSSAQADQSANVALNDAQGDAPDPFTAPTATLQPGVAWHTITKGENIISGGGAVRCKCQDSV